MKLALPPGEPFSATALALAFPLALAGCRSDATSRGGLDFGLTETLGRTEEQRLELAASVRLPGEARAAIARRRSRVRGSTHLPS